MLFAPPVIGGLRNRLEFDGLGNMVVICGCLDSFLLSDGGSHFILADQLPHALILLSRFGLSLLSDS